MTCKEEGCGFVTDSAEDEAHLPLVMKVVVISEDDEDDDSNDNDDNVDLDAKADLKQAYELHVSTAHGPPPHLEYVAPPTEGEPMIMIPATLGNCAN